MTGSIDMALLLAVSFRILGEIEASGRFKKILGLVSWFWVGVAFVRLVSSPVEAATLPPLPAIQIEECVQISVKDMARDAVERVDLCRWPILPENPFDLEFTNKLGIEEHGAPPPWFPAYSAAPLRVSRAQGVERAFPPRAYPFGALGGSYCRCWIPFNPPPRPTKPPMPELDQPPTIDLNSSILFLLSAIGAIAVAKVKTRVV